MRAECHGRDCRVRLQRVHLSADPTPTAPDSIDAQERVERGPTERYQPDQSHPSDCTADFALRRDRVHRRYD